MLLIFVKKKKKIKRNDIHCEAGAYLESEYEN